MSSGTPRRLAAPRTFHLLAAVAWQCLALSCGDAEPSRVPQGICLGDDGRPLPSGTQIFSPNQCTRTTCWNGEAQTEEVPCSWDCRVEGTDYRDGDSMQLSSGQKCSCQQGHLNCAGLAGGCIAYRNYSGFDGVYANGATVSSGNCNSCICENGFIRCTSEDCTGMCSHLDRWYPSGTHFGLPDGCNECECNDTHVYCTVRTCPDAIPCTSNEDCAPQAFCRPLVGCDGPGRCEPKPTSCDDSEAPVCGCDNVTYASSCQAILAGTNVAAEGACESLRCQSEGGDLANGQSFLTSACLWCMCRSGVVWCDPRPLSCGD